MGNTMIVKDKRNQNQWFNFGEEEEGIKTENKDDFQQWNYNEKSGKWEKVKEIGERKYLDAQERDAALEKETEPQAEEQWFYNDRTSMWEERISTNKNDKHGIRKMTDDAKYAFSSDKKNNLSRFESQKSKTNFGREDLDTNRYPAL